MKHILALGAATTIAVGVATPAHAQGKNPAGVNPTHYQCYQQIKQ